MNIKRTILNFYKQQGGFTLIEILVALVVLSVGILGCLALMTTILHGSRLLENQGIAQHIMQEGLEAVVKQRNENFLDRSNEAPDTPEQDKVAYNENLGDENYCIEYTQSGSGVLTITGQGLASRTSPAGCKVYFNPNTQTYSTTHSDSGVGVEFTRRITVERICSTDEDGNCTRDYDYLKVTSVVEWHDRTPRSIEGILRLYNRKAI